MRKSQASKQASMRRAVCGLTTFQDGMACSREQRVRVAVDCSLGHHMTHDKVRGKKNSGQLVNSLLILPQEQKSLARQIKEVYFANLHAPRPFQLYLTGLETDSRIYNALHTHIKNFSTFKARWRMSALCH